MRLRAEPRPRLLAGAWVRIRSTPQVWHGLTWGLCAPLALTASPDHLVRAWRVSVPTCLGAFLAAGWVLGALLRFGGLSAEESRRATARILTPSWIIAFSPVVLLVPLRNLPVFLAFVAVSLVLHRLVVEARPLFFAGRPAALETIVFTTLFVAVLSVLFQVRIVHDAFQYYGYLVSVALDRDLNLYDQIYIHNVERSYNPFPATSARYIGTAVMEGPFFLLGHLVAKAQNALGGQVPLDGYSLPYGFCATLASGLFGLGGLLASYRLARELYPRWTCMAATIAVWLASPLVFFMFVWGGWAHPFTFFSMACFLLLWQTTRGGRRTLLHWAGLGMLAGLIGLTRPPTLVVLVFPLFEWIAALRDRTASRSRSLVLGPALAALLAFVVFSPQLSAWKAISGQWLASPYREVGDFYAWLHPNVFGLLFSTGQHGLFTWTPLVLVAAAGIPALYRRDRLLAAGAAASVLLTFYLYACWSIWWTGIGFSNRFFIEMTPFLILGLAALAGMVEKRAPREWVWGGLAVAIVWNLFLIGGYRANEIPQGIPDPYRVVDEPLTFPQLVASNLGAGPAMGPPRWAGWLHDGFFTDRLSKAVTFSDPSALLGPAVILILVGAFSTLLIGRAIGGKVVSPGRRAGVLTVALGLAAVVALHGTIWAVADGSARLGRFHHLPDTGFVVRQPAADTWIYSDFPHPVTSVDLLTHLAYGHGVPQGAIVATATVYDASGRATTRTLRAGIDTAESSYLRPECRGTVRHGIEETSIARSTPVDLYSRHDYEMLTFRAVIELPEPAVVTKIGFRYVHPIGRLIVSDVFLRDF